MRNDARVTVVERRNARALDARRAALAARPDRGRRLVHLARARCCRPCSRAAAPRFDCLALVKPQFEVGRERVGKGGVVRDAATGAPRSWPWRGALASGSARRCSASPRRGCRARRATARASCGWPRRGRAGRGRGSGGGGAKGGAVTSPRARSRLHPPRPARHGDALRRADRELGGRGGRRGAHRRPRRSRSSGSMPGGVELRATPARRRPRARARRRRHDPAPRCARSPGTGVPVFAINYGAIGFLATVEPVELEEGVRARAARRVRRAASCPALVVATADGERIASTTSRCTGVRTGAWPSWPTRSRARSWARCAATASWSPRRPARRATTSPTAGRCWPGAWRATSVSFIAPHTLTARALVVAPGDS